MNNIIKFHYRSNNAQLISGYCIAQKLPMAHLTLLHYYYCTTSPLIYFLAVEIHRMVINLPN